MQDFRSLMERENERALFNKINVGKWHVSVQGSHTHYCTPRQSLSNPYEYEEFEVAIFDQNGNWFNPVDDERFEHMIDELENWESGDVAVGPYIPVNTVQKLIDTIEKFEMEE